MNLNLLILSIQIISENRTTPYNIVKFLKYELFILCIYLKNNNTPIGFITSFDDKLSTTLCYVYALHTFVFCIDDMYII